MAQEGAAFLDSLSNQLNTSLAQGGAPADQSQQQPQWTQEQIAAYYQQYGYGAGGYDYSQYYAQQAAASAPGADPNAAAYGAYGAYGAMPSYGGGYDASAVAPSTMSRPQWKHYVLTSSVGGFGAFPSSVGGGRFTAEPSKIIWIGGLHPETTEAELHRAFGHFNGLDSIKLVANKQCAFVRFNSLEAAIFAHSNMIGKNIHGNIIKVGWGKAEPGKDSEFGTVPCRNLCLLNMDPDINEEQIRNAFSKFGTIEKVKIVREKNCAFVNFGNVIEAKAARGQMNGQMLGTRPLKINFGRENEGLGYLDVAPASPLSKVEMPPPDAPDPEDIEQKRVIDTFVQFVIKNGASFENMTKERSKDNPKFGFLYPENPNNAYYLLKLWKARYPDVTPEQMRERKRLKDEKEAAEKAAKDALSAVPPPSALMSGVVMASGLTSPQTMTTEDTTQLSQFLDTLTGTRDSIKAAKTWITAHQDIAVDIASLIRGRAEEEKDYEKRLNILHLIHDVLHAAARSREKGSRTDLWADTFKPYLPAILRFAYLGADPEQQDKVSKVVGIWDEKRIFDSRTVRDFEDEMKGIEVKPRKPSATDDRDRDRHRERDRDRSRDRDDRDRRHRSDRDHDRDRDRGHRRH